eukprot:1405727-Pyramimonas_sp.AAC.2
MPSAQSPSANLLDRPITFSSIISAGLILLAYSTIPSLKTVPVRRRPCATRLRLVVALTFMMLTSWHGKPAISMSTRGTTLENPRSSVQVPLGSANIFVQSGNRHSTLAMAWRRNSRFLASDSLENLLGEETEKVSKWRGLQEGPSEGLPVPSRRVWSFSEPFWGPLGLGSQVPPPASPSSPREGEGKGRREEEEIAGVY